MRKKRNFNGSDVLYHAVKTGGKGDISNTLQHQSFNLEDTDKNSNTVLHLILENQILTEKEILEYIEIFLNHGVDPNNKNNKQETSLHLAVARRLKDVIEILIKYNATINPKIEVENRQDKLITHHFIKDEYEKFRHILELNNDQLHFWYNDTTESESVKFLEWLMEIGFDFDAEEKSGQSAIHLAIDCNLLHILPTLLKNTNRNDFLREDYKPLIRLFTEKNFLIKPYYERYFFSIIQILLDRRVSLAIETVENFEFIEKWINEFPNNNDGKNCATSLFLAIMRNCKEWSDESVDNHLKILGNLIAKGVDVQYTANHFEYTPLALAIKGKNVRALEFLERNGIDFQVKMPNGQNLLGLLVKKDFKCDKSEKVFEFLVSKGCDVNEKDNYGRSIIHSAVMIRNIKLVKKLIEHGAVIDCRDKNMQTPLHYVVRDVDAIELTELLLQNGANVNAKDVDGSRPLFRAIFTSMADLLLKFGAVIDTLQAIDEWSGLDFLIDKMTENSVKNLLDNGLQINPTSLFCRALLQYCTSNEKALTFLMQHWIRMKVANLLSAEDNRRDLHIQDNVQFYEDCLREIQLLKNTFIEDRTSLYNFLHMDLNSKCNYVRNKELKNIVDSPALKMNFRVYGSLILANYREAVARKPLIEPARQAWLELTKLCLPCVCIDRIIAHLGNFDLLMMIDND